MTDYQGLFHYENQVLKFIATVEGYVNTNISSGNHIRQAFSYVYNYTDHLGNIRLSYTKGTGVNPPVILEENHYYPFGLKHKKYGSVDKDLVCVDEDCYEVGIDVVPPQARKTYQYKYNGKEFQDELNLNVYDYGARNYQPDLGRYFNIDNFAEAFYNINPYQYTANNPVKFIDVNGDYIYIWENGTGYRYDNGKVYSQDKEGNWNEFAAKQGSYVAQILSTLNDITQGDKNSFGSQFLNLFANDNINVDVRNNPITNKRDKNYNQNLHQSGTIYTAFNQKVNTQTTDGLKSSPFHITLAHELAHGLSFNIINESERNKTWVPKQAGLGKDISQDEVFASMIENMIRSEQNLPLRTHYISGGEGSVIEQSRLIKKSKLKTGNQSTYDLIPKTMSILQSYTKNKKK